jgi:hypothetical protein
MKNPWMLLGTLTAALLAGVSWGQTADIQVEVKKDLAGARSGPGVDPSPTVPKIGGAAKTSGNLRGDVHALSSRIDELLDRKIREAGVQTSAPAEDANYFRRISLDLGGKIPNLIDIRDFLDDPDADKRWTRVERLLDSESFAKHFANVLRARMIATNNNFQALALIPSFELWLKEHLQKNHGYDKIVTELLTGQAMGGLQPFGAPGQPASASTAAFYFSNENKPENLAGATARLFLGVKLECAQCHAHPFAKWSRNQFWETAAFFAGIRPPQFRGNGVAVQASVGPRQIMIPGTDKVVKAKFLNGDEPAWKDDSDSRKILADWIIAKNNPYFARATADMLWQYFFGLSLLEPITEPHDDDPAITHEELLDELARQFTSHDYDLKFLIRAIVHSRAYQRSSIPAGKPGPDDLHLFARMPVRGLSPEQFFDSVAEAIEYQEPPNQNMNRQFFNQPLTPRLEFLNKFADQEKRTETQTSILQALFLMNGKFLTRWTKLDPGLTRDKLFEFEERRMKGFPVDVNIGLHNIAVQPTSTARKIETMYLWVLSRLPRPEETERLVRHVEQANRVHALMAASAGLSAPTIALPVLSANAAALGDSLSAPSARQAIADIYWALLNSGEFMLNH